MTGVDTRIRIWGLDAPEQDRAGGSAATATLTRLIAGQELACRQRDIDRYGRIVGQCFLADGRDIAAVMIASGTAREFCRYRDRANARSAAARFDRARLIPGVLPAGQHRRGDAAKRMRRFQSPVDVRPSWS